MSHPQQNEFLIWIKALYPKFFHRVVVLDIGSLDINGNPRYLFSKSAYIGIDKTFGKNVSAVLDITKDNVENFYDTILYTEAAEHDSNWQATITAAWKRLKPGGLFLFTCATTGRAEHGTWRQDPEMSPGTNDYYRNLTREDIRSIEGWPDFWRYGEFYIDNQHHDLYFFGFKKGGRQSEITNLISYIRVYVWNLIKYFTLQRFRDFKRYF